MIVKLKDVCELVAGYAFKSKDFGNFDEKVIKITQINPPYVNLNGALGINLSKYNKDKLKKYLVKKGDYVFAMTGATIGKIGRLVDGQAYLNQQVLLFKPYKTINKEYLYYVLQSYEFSQYVRNHIDSESAQPNISADTVGSFEFALHSFEDQEKIAEILGSIDRKIENNNRINDNLSNYLKLSICKTKSPLKRRGNNKSRNFDSLLFSSSFKPICLNNGEINLLKLKTSSLLSLPIGSAPMFCG